MNWPLIFAACLGFAVGWLCRTIKATKQLKQSQKIHDEIEDQSRKKKDELWEAMRNEHQKYEEMKAMQHRVRSRPSGMN